MDFIYRGVIIQRIPIRDGPYSGWCLFEGNIIFGEGGGAYLRRVLICGSFFEGDFIQKEPCLKKPFLDWDLFKGGLFERELILRCLIRGGLKSRGPYSRGAFFVGGPFKG